MSLANRLILIIGLFIVVLVLSNPSEKSFLNRIGEEYGSVHHGMKFSPGQLLEIGTGNRNNLVIFSKYRYQFGTIAVEYFGFCGMIFKTYSDSNLPELAPDNSKKIVV